ncbi:MAG: DUF1638 domain-containing protein, partial [Deltaproteobacteria bacterium]|nr:DUF1638 domain-containing protein [Deltaproteobacteria bacterium]
MKILLVACETIEDEIKTALLSLEIDYEVLWLEGGLHFNPNHLRDRLQQVFDEAQGRYDRLLVSFGYCGGGVSGLTTYDYETVLPLADDCLSLLLGSMQARQLASKPPTYFLTSGWMRHENNVVTSYQKCIEKYGLRRSERIHRIMLHNYHRFGLVETGCYDMKNAVQQVQDLAQAMDLKVETLPGDLEWVKRFLLGPYDDPER